MRLCRFLLPVLACSALPLGAGLVTIEEFSGVGVPAGWSTTISTGYGISITGTGDAIFTKSINAPFGSGQLTYGTAVSGDFLAVGIVSGYSLANGSSILLDARWSAGSDRVSAGISQVGGAVRQAAGDSRTMEFPWAPWTSADAVLVLYRTGNNIQAGVMDGIPESGGIPDFSGFSPLGSWTGDEYLGDLVLSLALSSFGTAGAASAGVDVFALAAPPYLPDVIPPEAVPEPVTAGLAAAGLFALWCLRRRRGRD